MEDTGSNQNKTKKLKFQLFNFVTSQSISNNLSTRKILNKSFTIMKNTSNRQHETGKPKGSDGKMPAQNFDHRKTKTFCLRRGEHVVYNVIKYK